MLLASAISFFGAWGWPLDEEDPPKKFLKLEFGMCMGGGRHLVGDLTVLLLLLLAVPLLLFETFFSGTEEDLSVRSGAGRSSSSKETKTCGMTMLVGSWLSLTSLTLPQVGLRRAPSLGE